MVEEVGGERRVRRAQVPGLGSEFFLFRSAALPPHAPVYRKNAGTSIHHSITERRVQTRGLRGEEEAKDTPLRL